MKLDDIITTEVGSCCVYVQYPDGGTSGFRVAHNKPEELLEVIFAAFNHGSQQESKVFLNSKTRSMSVGDFVTFYNLGESSCYRVEPTGFKKVDSREFLIAKLKHRRSQII
tara:strand:+ start:82660 stop:82992 length:333 start_codon:yes stop_codon:yes gene_type:complete